MDTIDWLKTLIAFDTTSRNSNLQLIDCVADYLSDLGLQPWLAHNAERTKANLFVSIPAASGSLNGGIVLSGHTDVVPVDGQPWTSDPFTATVRDGRLYGRGSCDMKGFIAAALAAVPQMKAARLKAPLHLALSYDEEIGCLGAPVMLDALGARGLQPQYCIVGEPTSMRMVVAHKGIHTFCCDVYGKTAHSSLTPQGVNAVEYAAKIIVFLNGLAQSLQRRADLDHAFDVPFSTLSAGVIHGGTAVNIIPDHCRFEFDCRNLPHMSPEEILQPLHHYIRHELEPAMRAVDERCRIELKPCASVPAMGDTDNHVLQALIENLVYHQQRTKVAYATEGGQFQAAGMPTVICGPGSIAQAHKADEYIELAQLARCDRFLAALIAHQAA